MAERRLQPRFIIKALIRLAFLLPLIVVLESDREDDWPDRKPRPPAVAMIEARPLALPPGGVIGGLWELRSGEVRFGGLSSLAWDEGALVAVSDSGVAMRWRPPAGRAEFRDLPAGPGRPQWKINRDSEALVADSGGRGWWVTFEQTHGAWLFDRRFERALGRRPVRLRTWWRNWGVEAAVSRPDGLLLLLPEYGREAILLRNRGEIRRPLEVDGAIADAAVMDGRVVVAVRHIRPWGISNSLGWLEEGEGYRVERWADLPLARWDNVEGLAVERRADGTKRLWFVTDNDRQRRTLLGWVDLETAKAPARAEAFDR
ncbi:esterase-like activity of phytase family protein [Sphingomonas sp. LHG3406-1]|uniref:esterase-like activity of phytase family protein n=1 Tax=Sphingomonas sp. LHG3406-1 TaxID=2804617 RepID=UPI00261173AD|nr:esterase-like activity of phytase family protein [Sphingomonas sp. LHG3406-1]